MGWKSQTEIVRAHLGSSQQASLIAKIRGGDKGRAFVHSMALALPYPYLDVFHYGAEDKWGLRFASCISKGKHSTTDQMWEGLKEFLNSIPFAQVSLHIEEIEFSDGPVGELWEKWMVIKTPELLRTQLKGYEGDMPVDMRRVLTAVQEHNGRGRAGCWETLIIKHTVVRINTETNSSSRKQKVSVQIM